MPLIEYNNVSRRYEPGTVALHNISLQVEPGEFVSITGKSGAGKTTLIRLLLGEDTPTDGTVRFNEEEVPEIPPKFLPRHRRNFGIVFQDYKLLPDRTAFENVAFALEVMGREEEEIADTVPQALDIVDMHGKTDSFPEELSGGEKQRIAMARAIIHQPEVLIADEPTGNLDPYHSWEIVKLLTKIHELGTTVLLATHDREIINYLQKRVITLDSGEIVRDAKHGRYMV